MSLVEKMNKCLTQYLPDFPRSYAPHMEFSEDEEENIYFNGAYICSDKDLELQFTAIEIDSIIFYFNKNRTFRINLVWNQDKPPEISSFGFESDMVDDERAIK